MGTDFRVTVRGPTDFFPRRGKARPEADVESLADRRQQNSLDAAIRSEEAARARAALPKTEQVRG